MNGNFYLEKMERNNDGMEVVMQHHDRLEIPEGFYLETICHSDWVIPERYTDLQNVGSGAYGSVCSARDNENDAVRAQYAIIFS